MPLRVVGVLAVVVSGIALALGLVWLGVHLGGVESFDDDRWAGQAFLAFAAAVLALAGLARARQERSGDSVALMAASGLALLGWALTLDAAESGRWLWQ